jgi:hypothetical protein
MALYPPPPHGTFPYEQAVLLKGNTDSRLTGKWIWQIAPAWDRIDINTWTRAMDCDDVLEIESQGTTMNIYRLLRRMHQVDREDQYSLVQTIINHDTNTMANAAMADAYELVPE